jgi:hypothetical protein
MRRQQGQISPFLVYACPFGHGDLCPRNWSTRYAKNEIICLCFCHKNRKKDLK